MGFYVFVNSITKTEHKGIVVQASNGSLEGPPFVRFTLLPAQMRDCYIGKRYHITIEEEL